MTFYYITPTSYAATSHTGVVLLSCAATSATIPIVVGGNDPRLPSATITGGIYNQLELDTYGHVMAATLQPYVTSDFYIYTSAPLTGGGDLSSPITLSIPSATSGQDGYLSGIDWDNFNGKLGDAPSDGTIYGRQNNSWVKVEGGTASVGDFYATAPLTSQGDLSTALTISIPAATAGIDGYLAGTDWTAFSGKLDPDGDGSQLTGLTDTQIAMGQLGTPTYGTLHDFESTLFSSGRITGLTISAHSPADGTVDVAAGTFGIHTTNSLGSDWVFADFAGVASVALTDKELNYLYMDYNSGTPQVLVTLDRTTVNQYNQFIIGRVYRDGTDASEITNSGVNIYNFYRRIHDRLLTKYGFDRASGSIIAESDTRKLSITSGIWYIGNTQINTASHDSNAGYTFETFYYNPTAAAWVETSGVSQLGNTQYNNIVSGTGLATLGNNKYGVYWIYQCPTSDFYVVYGQAEYATLTDAQAAEEPSILPAYLTQNSHVVGRLIFQKNGTNFAEVASAFLNTFIPSAASNHNELGGIQGGTTDEYYHLTSAQHTVATQAASSSLDGYLSSTNWTTFNGKVSTSRTISTTSPLTGGGDLSSDRTISIPAATAGTNGYLTGADWSTFNGKQAALGFTPREVLSAARTYYVRTDGNDSNNGLADTSGGAFLTVQKAIDTVCGIDMGVYQVTIQVGAGTYTGTWALNSYVGALPPIILGDTTTPSNVVISTAANCCVDGQPMPWYIKGFKFTTSSGSCLIATNGALLHLYNLELGSCTSRHLYALRCSVIVVYTNLTVSGSAANFVYTTQGGVINTPNVTITLSGTPNFTSAFAYNTFGNIIISGCTFSGSATGVRYYVGQNGVLNTGGGGATYLPGNSAGSADTGGQYI